MVSALLSGSSGLGLSPGRGYCAVSLGKTLYSHSASLWIEWSGLEPRPDTLCCVLGQDT